MVTEPNTSTEPASDTGNGKTPIRNAKGQFLKGSPSLGGRQRGSRNELSESFLADLHTEWKRSGRKALERVAATNPETFLKIVASVMPRLIEIEGALHISGQSELAIEVRDFASAYHHWGQFIGARNPPMIQADIQAAEFEEIENGESADAGE
jgi:hypothetical protein